MTDLTELFSRDPLNHTKDSIGELIKELREKRHLFNLGNMKAATLKAPKPTKLQAALGGTGLKLDLSAIQLKK